MAEKNKRLKKNFSGVLILLLLLLSLWQYSSSGVKAENNAAITKSIIWTIYAVGEAGAARRPSIAADINKISTFILPAGKYKVAGQMYYNKKNSDSDEITITERKLHSLTVKLSKRP